MGWFKVIRHLSEEERPKERPIPPKPRCIGATKEEWDAYWIESGAYYDGIELIIKDPK